MNEPSLREMTTEIVAAHVANNPVSVADVAILVRTVHDALASVGEHGPVSLEEQKGPVISVRSSIKPDHIACLLCGRKQKTLKRHLQVAHDLTPEQYRARFDLPKSYPMVAPEYSKRRGDMARRIGLGRTDDLLPSPLAFPQIAAAASRKSGRTRQSRAG